MVILQTLPWNTAHVAAQALLDMLDSKEPYLHLVHPKPVVWNVVISIFSRKLGLPVVPVGVWADALERSHELALSNASQMSGDQSREVMRQAMRQNPALRMRGLFGHGKTSGRDKNEGMGQLLVLTPRVRAEKAIAASPTLSDPNFPRMGEDDVDRWMSNWRRVGFMNGGTEKSLL